MTQEYKLFQVTVIVVADDEDEARHGVERGIDKQGFIPIELEVAQITDQERVDEITRDWE